MPKKSSAERRVRVFKNGRNQAIGILREFELPTKDAVMQREGAKLIIEPVSAKSLLDVLASLKPIRDKFPPVSDPLPQPTDL